MSQQASLSRWTSLTTPEDPEPSGQSTAMVLATPDAEAPAPLARGLVERVDEILASAKEQVVASSSSLCSAILRSLAGQLEAALAPSMSGVVHPNYCSVVLGKMDATLWAFLSV